ncbi:MAG TPA: MFS transporter [Polyangiaceae bacterium]|nr:MFS transporter [Polyangiaceae bacterium]
MTSVKPSFSSYQKQLFVFLSVANFFEGYDFFAISQLLPSIRETYGLSPEQGTWLISLINFGTILAYLLVRRADRWGRRQVLSITIAGYALFTFLSAWAPNAVLFGLLQMVARIFLIGEWATSMVVAAEEYPAERRGMVIGVVSASGGLGSIVCAGVVPLLLKTPLGWRSVYLVGVVPLLLLMYARRGLRETQRFTEAAGSASREAPLWEILRGPHRRRVLELGAIWFLSYICTNNAVTFWKEFALKERGLTHGQTAMIVSVAAVVSMPLVFFAGRMLDAIGRRRGSLIIYLATVLGVLGAYTFWGVVPLLLCMTVGIFGINAVLTVLNTFMTELFPTEVRGNAVAWSNNLIGRLGYCFSPLAIGLVVEQHGWGVPLRLSTVFPLLALVLIFWWLPETKSRELEDTSRAARA